MQEDFIQVLNTRLSAAKATRLQYETVWRDISKYINPNRADFPSKTSITEGQNRSNKIYDSVGIDSARTLASALTNSLTNPQSRWVGFVPRDKSLVNSDAVRRLSGETEDVLLANFNSSSSQFYQQNHQFMLDLAAYGTAIMYVDDKNGSATFRAIPLAQIYIEEDIDGNVNTVYRTFKLTGLQILDKWESELTGDFKDELNESLDKKFDIVHTVLPSSTVKRISGHKEPKEFSSVYFMEGRQELLSMDGFFEQPYIVSRWEKLTGETYGRGSGSNSISDVAMLQVMGEAGVRATQMTTSPSWLVSDDGVVTDVRAVPNGLIVGGLDESGTKRVQPLDYNPRLDFLELEIDQRRESVRKAFFVDRLERKQGTPVTATESIDNQQVRLVLAAPQLFRLQIEYLTPVLDRVYNINKRAKNLPDIPPEIEDEFFDFEYQSPIIKAQRREELSSFNIAIQSLGPLINNDATILDVIDASKAFRNNLEVAGFPIKLVRTQEEEDKIKTDREEAAKQKQQQEAATQAADSVANLNKSGVEL